MKRVLYIAYFFPPLGGAGVQRSLKFVRYLPRFGWSPTVLTGAARYWLHDPSLLDELEGDPDVHRVGVPGGRWLGMGAGSPKKPVASDAAAPPSRADTDADALERGAASDAGAPSGRAASDAGVLERRPASDAAPRSGSRLDLLRSAARFFLVPDAYVGWVGPATRRACELMERERFDAVVTTSSPDSAHLIGRRLKQRFGVPWVADFRDPWVGRLSYAPPTPLHDRWHRRLERACVRDADAVVVTSESTREDYLARIAELRADDVHVITNGYDEDDFAAAEARLDEPEGAETGWTSDVLHAGQLNPERPIDVFLDGLRRYRERASIREVGDGTDGRTRGTKASGQEGSGPEARGSEASGREANGREASGPEASGPGTSGRESREDTGPLRSVLFLGGHYDRDVEAVERRGLGDVVRFRDNVSHLASVASLLRARSLLLLEQDSDRGRLILPGKTFEYLRAHKPILALVPRGGAADRLVRSFDAGYVADPRDPADVAEGLARLASLPPRVAGGLDVFERRAITERLAALLDRCVPAASGRSLSGP